jgi:hypothetical protein
MKPPLEWEGSPRRNATLDCGWGRLVFAQTYDNAATLAEALRAERPDQRDIAFYVYDPHVALAAAPQELFLDHELAELAARIPSRHKLAHDGKGVLKEAARQVIPHDVIDRPKGYFPVPALKYLDGPYLEMVRDALTSQAARERGLFRQDYLDRLFDAPAEHITKLRGSELWQVGLLELWLQSNEVRAA